MRLRSHTPRACQNVIGRTPNSSGISQFGTRSVLSVSLITWIGYPSLAVLFLLLWGWAMEKNSNAKRAIALLIPLPFLAVGHALGLQAIKNALGL